MNTHDIELPAEFHSGNDIPVTVATIKRERMEEILRAAIEADRKHRFENGKALRRYKECGGDEEKGPIERLRFYCSLAMSGQDWLDVQPFFDDLEADRQRSGEPVSKIDPNPPQLSIVWHDSPESVDRAMWEQAAIEAGVTYEELIEGSNVGETEDGEVLEFAHEQAIDGMRAQGCWGFVDTKTNTINAWAADDVDAPTALHFLAHEIGHVTGEQLDDDMQEEMRAEQFGSVAALAYRLWCEKKNDAPQPAEPVKRKRRYAQGTALGEFGIIPMCDQVDDEPVKVPSALPVTEQEEEAWQQMEKQQ